VLSFIGGGQLRLFITYTVLVSVFFGSVIALTRAGKIRWAASVFIGLFWVLIVVTSYFFGGTENSGMMVLIVMVVLAFLLINVQAGVIVTILSILAAVGLFWLSATGQLPEPLETIDAFNYMVVLIAALLFTVIPMSIVMRSLSSSRQALLHEIDFRRKAEQDVVAAYEETLEGWARTLEYRNQETEGHSRRVIDLTLQLARRLEFPEEYMDDLYRGALLHDIGKIAISNAILRKPGSLNDEEWAIVRQHPLVAQELLSPIDYLQQALVIPLCHHENWDGSGYPQGLKGKEIPLPARIFSVVDNWDALTTDRPYASAWTHGQALRYLKEQGGKKFDPDIVAVFIALVETGKG
jgi:hypothetical protein